jgi:hypothetical protein
MKDEPKGKIIPRLPEPRRLHRREVLLEILKKSGQIFVATNVIYSVSHFTLKNGNTAGAK